MPSEPENVPQPFILFQSTGFSAKESLIHVQKHPWEYPIFQKVYGLQESYYYYYYYYYYLWDNGRIKIKNKNTKIIKL